MWYSIGIDEDHDDIETTTLYRSEASILRGPGAAAAAAASVLLLTRYCPPTKLPLLEQWTTTAATAAAAAILVAHTSRHVSRRVLGEWRLPKAIMDHDYSFIKSRQAGAMSCWIFHSTNHWSIHPPFLVRTAKK
jgi:ABC-type enterobactin transport system permease subunit